MAMYPRSLAETPQSRPRVKQYLMSHAISMPNTSPVERRADCGVHDYSIEEIDDWKFIK